MCVYDCFFQQKIKGYYQVNFVSIILISLTSYYHFCNFILICNNLLIHYELWTYHGKIIYSEEIFFNGKCQADVEYSGQYVIIGLECIMLVITSGLFQQLLVQIQTYMSTYIN